MLPARQQPHPFTPFAQTINQEETKNSVKRSDPQQIVLKPETWANDVDLEPNPERGSNKINKLRPGRKNRTQNRLYHTSWTHK